MKCPVDTLQYPANAEMCPLTPLYSNGSKREEVA